MRTEISSILPIEGLLNSPQRPVSLAGARHGRIVYLVESPLGLRDYRRFGMGWMVQQGYQVHVLDVADLTFPQMPKDRGGYYRFDDIEIRVIRSLAEFRDASPLLDGARLLICLVA